MPRRARTIEQEAAQIAVPQMYGVAAIALRLGIGKDKVYRAMDAGRLRYKRLGGRRLCTDEQIAAYVDGTAA